jgi:hypothetical protein
VVAWIGTATTSLAGGRGDFGGAGEAGPHFGDLGVEGDRDLEVRRLRRARRRSLDRAVADLGHLAGEGLAGIASIVTLATAELHVRDVGLVDFDFRLDDRHVGDRQQHRAGVVHRADDDRFPSSMFRRVMMPVIGDSMRTLLRFSLRVLERRLLPASCAALGLDLPLGGVSRPAHPAPVLGVVQRFLRRQALLAELLLAVEAGPAPASATSSCCRSTRAAAPSASAPRRATPGLVVDGRQVARVDLQQELALCHALAFLDRQSPSRGPSCRR